MKKNKKFWQTLSSKVVHKNPWYKINKDKVIYPSGKLGEYYVVEAANASIVIPIKNNKIIFVKQYRYPVRKWSTELPKGGVKRSFLLAAREELMEETGYKSGDMRKIGKFATVPGWTSDFCCVYVARNLNFLGRKLDSSEEEAKIKTIEISIDKAYKMIEEGKIIDGQTIAALSLARKILFK